jgi:RNA polymerase sigma-70 factor (ECF subfamily)
MDDRENRLVNAVLAGDTRAFEALVTPYGRPLLIMAFRLTRNEEDAKEMVQEALMKAFQHLEQFDQERSFRNWLFQILVNATRKFAAKSEPHDELTSSLEVEGNRETGNGLDYQELRSKLMDCLAVLSVRERAVFLLRDIEGQDIKETTQILHSSSISVRVHLSSARKKINNEMRRRFPNMLKGLP